MPWFYVDDGFSDSKPVMNMPDRYRLAACGLWVLSGSWSAKEMTDGFVPMSKLKSLGAKPAHVEILTSPGDMDAALWEQKRGGIVFKNWSKWQKTRAEILAKREQEATKKRNQRSKGRTYLSSINGGMSLGDTEPPDSDGQRAVPQGRTGIPIPIPTLSSNESVSSPVGAGPDDAHTPKPFCDNHPGGTRQRCGDCANARREYENWQADTAERNAGANAALAAELADIRAAIDQCTNGCDSYGRLDDLSPCPNHRTLRDFWSVSNG